MLHLLHLSSINLTNLTNHIYENEHTQILFFREIPFFKFFRYFCEFISENLRFFIFSLGTNISRTLKNICRVSSFRFFL